MHKRRSISIDNELFFMLKQEVSDRFRHDSGELSHKNEYIEHAFGKEKHAEIHFIHICHRIERKLNTLLTKSVHGVSNCAVTINKVTNCLNHLLI